MKIIEALTSVLLYSIGTLLLFVGVLTAVGMIGIPIMFIGKKLQDASEIVGG